MAESRPDDPLHADATICTVDELNADVAALVESQGLAFDYVVGDVSDRRAANGHLHFDLSADGASIHCVAFGFRRADLTDAVEDGARMAVAGDLSFYEPQGSCSVVVSDVVALGDGTYAKRYRENKRALEDDGLLDDEHKQPLPELPRRVGLVTSADSDAREDAITSIHDRHPDVDVVVYHASVQGEAALPELLEAVSVLERDPEVDLLVVTRGGGADTTLRVFNEVPLCRALFETDTPCVVGVGHEQDETLAGEVADERVMTPTDVGSVVPEKEALEDEYETVAESLEAAYERTVTDRLDETEAALEDAYATHATGILEETQRDLEVAFETLARERLTALDGRLDHAYDNLEREVEHERETREIEATYEKRQRRQRIAIAVLVVALLALAAYLVFGP